MIPAVSALFSLVVAITVAVVCVREMAASGLRGDLCLLAALAGVIAFLILRRAWRFLREVRDAVELGDH